MPSLESKARKRSGPLPKRLLEVKPIDLKKFKTFDQKLDEATTRSLQSVLEEAPSGTQFEFTHKGKAFIFQAVPGPSGKTAWIRYEPGRDRLASEPVTSRLMTANFTPKQLSAALVRSRFIGP